MVLNKWGDKLYNNLTETLRKYLSCVAGEIEATQGSKFLPEVKLRWLNYNKSMQMIGCGAHAHTTTLCAVHVSARCLSAFWAPPLRVRPVRPPHVRSISLCSIMFSISFRCYFFRRDILMYMDRTNRDHYPEKLQVHDLGLVLWRDNVVRHARTPLTSASPRV
jgi:hypothetical protein